MKDLQKQTINSVKWTTIQTVVSALVGPVFLVVKSRFLAPSEFAYIAIISMVIVFFQFIETFGISQAVIQKNHVSQKDASSLFFFNVITSILLVIAIFFLSPFIALFFKLPDLERYLPIVSLVLLFTAPSLLLKAFLQKELKFKVLSQVEIFKNLLMVIVTIVLLLMGKKVMAVIFGQIAATFLSTAIVVFLSYRMKLIKLKFFFKISCIKDYLKFGVYVFGKQIMTFTTQHLDEVMIGYFLAPEALGIYHFGKNMLLKLKTLISQSFTKVLFPVFSKLKKDESKRSWAYSLITKHIAFISFPLFLGIASTAHLFVPIFFGDKWLDSIIVFQIFSVTVIPSVLTANIATSLLYSVKKANAVFYIDLITNCIYFGALFIWGNFLGSQGIISILVLYSSYILIKTTALQYWANIYLDQKFRYYFLALFKPAGFSILMVVVVVAVNVFGQELGFSDVMILVSCSALGILSYSIMAFMFDKEILMQIKNAVTKGKITAG